MHLTVETMVKVGRNGEPINHCMPDSVFAISRSLRHRMRIVVAFSFESSSSPMVLESRASAMELDHVDYGVLIYVRVFGIEISNVKYITIK